MSQKIAQILERLEVESSNSGATIGNQWIETSGEKISSISPVNGEEISTVTLADTDAYEKVIKGAQEAFKEWRIVPAPQRGEIVRQIGNELREHKQELGTLVIL